MPDCDGAQLDGVNGPLHSLLPADGGGEEEHKDGDLDGEIDHASTKMREIYPWLSAETRKIS